MASIKFGIREEKPVVKKANSSNSAEWEERDGVTLGNRKGAKVTARLRGSIGKTVFNLHAFTGRGGYHGVAKNRANTQTGDSTSNKREHSGPSDMNSLQVKENTEKNSPLFQKDLAFPRGEGDLLKGIWDPDLGQSEDSENFNSEAEIAAVESKERVLNSGNEQSYAQDAAPLDRFLLLSGPWCCLEGLDADEVQITI